MKVVCIKEVECGYVPVTHYKEGDIVEISSIRNGYFLVKRNLFKIIISQ